MSFIFQKLEAAFLHLLWCLLKQLPVVMASNIMGQAGRLLGPYFPMSRIADVNLRLALPHYTAEQRRQIIRHTWDNLGRTIGEFPHIASLPHITAHTINNGAGWRIVGIQHLREAYQSGRPIIFFSGHLGNWELMPALVARCGMPFASFYRAPNNPDVDHLIRALRRQTIGPSTPMFPKGAKGAREAWRYLSQGGHLGILGDQKMNDGILSSFFGHPSMTASAAAALALRFNALIITGHVWRAGPARLVLEVDPPLEASIFRDQSHNRQESIHKLTQFLNNRLQSWIEKRPDHWLWFHRRWDKSLYR